jgi:hypothetical protein
MLAQNDDTPNMIAVADALREGRADVAQLAALETPDVMARVRELCALLTANTKAQWPTCASNWTLYQPDVIKSGTKYLRIVEYQATTIHTRDYSPLELEGIPPSEIDENGYRYLGPDRSGRSVWAFVELSNGLVWKSASWKKPALNFPRGCVHDPASLERMSRCLYGVTSLGAYHEELR